MARSLTVLFRRDPTRDRPAGDRPREGYRILWPDGSPVAVGLDAFCLHGRRLLGLGRHLAGRPERLLELVCFPLGAYEDELTRLPGHRVRRFCLRREGPARPLALPGRHPTEVFFEAGQDDPACWTGSVCRGCPRPAACGSTWPSARSAGRRQGRRLLPGRALRSDPWPRGRDGHGPPSAAVTPSAGPGIRPHALSVSRSGT
jgi:hypothetical protein